MSDIVNNSFPPPIAKKLNHLHTKARIATRASGFVYSIKAAGTSCVSYILEDRLKMALKDIETMENRIQKLKEHLMEYKQTQDNARI